MYLHSYIYLHGVLLILAQEQLYISSHFLQNVESQCYNSMDRAFPHVAVCGTTSCGGGDRILYFTRENWPRTDMERTAELKRGSEQLQIH